ncbi:MULTISPECIES: FkbM family methyltransferase [unclassified Thioalkalivibrio]|uniref:FkbM family methyltransferase n=1 Tax=unclassified Thioalkalivibrio TaxID=2621013 RepID=UPI00036AE717|nr:MULTISPECIES: FkbM family methyltransferase [unclassified Thioalkalivibrio]
MDLDSLPDELKALYAHRCPADAERKAAYEASPLSEEADTFVLYRIIGNDLYPRHAKGQSRQNVRFILENEPELAGCEKRWVLNRIFDAGERQAIIELLEQHGQSYLEIPFDAAAFAQIGWDYSAYPEPGFLSSAAFHNLEPLQQDRVLTAAYRKKNLYLMNNNGARNAALEDGRGRAKWVLPWDGNCFVTPSAWDSIRSAVRAAPYLPYFAVPMQRITDNAELLRDNFSPSPVEEPQLLFRRDARERFGENHPYGRRPKVELFWRLGIPGKWDRWKDASWDQPRAEPSPEAGAWGVAGWVARLASGKAHLEASTNESFQNRGVERQKAIRAAINHVTRQVSAQPDPIGLTSYRFEAIEALRAEYQEQSEAGPRAGLLQTLLQNAADALERQPESPVDKPEPGPSGDPQDYYHPAPYWWPNPDTKDGLPYVRRDGERVPGTRMYEPESHRYDRTRLQRLFDDTTTLALAAFVTGDQRHATHAVRWLERWFIDPATRMNPHLTYAQVRWGRNGNRGAQTGIIEMKDLYYALDAVRLLHHIGALSSDQLERLRAWFRDYLDWLLTSEQGTKEAQARNNHGTYYDLQVAAVAAFLDEHDTLYATLARAEERIPLQISPTGIQYEEMTRTITAHYCCFTLQGWLNLLNLAARFDGSFVARAAEPDHPLRKAVEWLLAHEGFPWPYPQIDEFHDLRFWPLKVLAKELGLVLAKISINERPVRVSFPPHDGVQAYWPLSISSLLISRLPSTKVNTPSNHSVFETKCRRHKQDERSAIPLTIAFPHRGAKRVLKPSGSTISMMLLASGLRAAGINAVVLLHKDGASTAECSGELRKTVGPWAEYCSSYGVPCYTVDSPYMGKDMPSDSEQEKKVQEFIPAWRKALNTIGVDAIHTNDASMHSTWGVLLERLMLPHVWHERGLFKHKRAHLIRQASVVLAISDYVRGLAAEGEKERILVVENPVDVPSEINPEEAHARLRSELGLESGAVVFGAVASANQRKRWDRFVELARRVFLEWSSSNLRSPVYFVAIGGGCAEVARILQSENCGGEKPYNIVLAGYRSPAFESIAGLDCLLALADEEPLGRTLVEAGQLGVPVFANKSGGHVHVLEPYAPDWLFSLDDGLDDLIKSCISLIRDPNKFKERATREESSLKHRFSPSTHVRNIFDIYKERLGNGKGSSGSVFNNMLARKHTNDCYGQLVGPQPERGLDAFEHGTALIGRNGFEVFVNPEDSRVAMMKRKGGLGQKAVYRVWDWAARENFSTHFLDVGANYGEIALGVRYPEGATVRLFEANPELSGYLETSIRKHPDGLKMARYMVAIGDQAGTVEFAKSERSSGVSSVVFDRSEGEVKGFEVIEVPIARLSDLAQSCMWSDDSAVLKIDVEGAEVDVLSGACDWLERMENYLAIIEFNPECMRKARGSLEKFIGDIEEFGELFEVSGSGLIPFRAEKFLADEKNRDVVLVSGADWLDRISRARL